MDIVTLSLCKKLVAAAAAGISSMSIDGDTLKIVLRDGSQLSYTFPTPEDGIGVSSMSINENKELICKMTDNSTINAGVVPTLYTYKVNTLTQAQYDALENYDEDTFYFIEEE